MERIPLPDAIGRAIKALQGHGFTVTPVEDGDRALAELQTMIPRGAEVMTGSSTTLIEIGFEDLIAGKKCGWKDLHTGITAENDDAKRAELRRKSVTADYFVSSASAITETGEIFGCDASGAGSGHGRLPPGTSSSYPGSTRSSRPLTMPYEGSGNMSIL